MSQTDSEHRSEGPRDVLLLVKKRSQKCSFLFIDLHGGAVLPYELRYLFARAISGAANHRVGIGVYELTAIAGCTQRKDDAPRKYAGNRSIVDAGTFPIHHQCGMPVSRNKPSDFATFPGPKRNVQTRIGDENVMGESVSVTNGL